MFFEKTAKNVASTQFSLFVKSKIINYGKLLSSCDTGQRMIEVFFRWHAILNQLTAPLLDASLLISASASYVRRRSDLIEYLSSGGVGQSNIVLLAKKAESSDTQATHSTDCARPLVQLTVQEQGMFKYHASSCCGLSRSARSLTSIRDKLNEGSAEM